MKHLVQDPSTLIGKQVRVYRNLHKDCWSIQLNGRVVAHASNIKLRNVSFKVLPGGYQRFLREGKKNVHAFIVGEVEGINLDGFQRKGTEVSYNPRMGSSFHTVKKIFKGREFFFSGEVLTHGFCSDKTVFVWDDT